MLRKLTATDPAISTAILRFVLGLVFFAHGAQKMLGWFGGYGFSGTMGFFTGSLHIPAVFAFLAIAAEFFGGLGLMLGLLTRVAGIRHRRQHARRHRDGSQPVRLLHELGRHSKRRRFRIPPSGAGDGCVPDHRGRGCSFHRSEIVLGGPCLNEMLRSSTIGEHSKGTRPTAPQLWIVLARSYRSLSSLVERSIADTGLGLSDFMVIEVLLHKGPFTISEIQGKVLLASGSMTAAIDRLEQRGLLVRKTTSSDRRARLLELTPEGTRLAKSAFQKHTADLERVTSILNEAEKRSYMSL